MIPTASHNQLAEAVCQRCSYDNVTWKAQAKNLQESTNAIWLQAVAEPFVRASPWDCF